MGAAMLTPRYLMLAAYRTFGALGSFNSRYAACASAADHARGPMCRFGQLSRTDLASAFDDQLIKKNLTSLEATGTNPVMSIIAAHV